MKRILVTGANGFTGKKLTTYLKSKGVDVILAKFDLCSKTETSQAVHELSSQANIDWVIHLAAISFVAHKDVSAFYKVNVLGTENLLFCLSKLTAKPKVLIASSANVYGNVSAAQALDEDTCPNPTNHYACSKLSMEHIAKQYLNQLQIVITRPFNYTGLNQDAKFLIPKIVNHFRNKNKVIELGNIDVSRDFCSVDDVVLAYWKIISTENNITNGEVVNICSGKATSLIQIIKYLEELAGYRIEIRINPEFVRENEIKMLYGSNQKLKYLTGFTPSQNSVQQAIKKMYLASAETDE